jgi:hypothetical protein
MGEYIIEDKMKSLEICTLYFTLFLCNLPEAFALMAESWQGGTVMLVGAMLHRHQY